ADVVAGQHGRVIKSIGDAVLFVNEDPIRAFDTAEGIIAVVGRDPRMPDVRVGLSTGSGVTRLGDVFGPPVNLAARLTAVARRNRVIVDRDTATLLPEDQLETRALPARPGAACARAPAAVGGCGGRWVGGSRSRSGGTEHTVSRAAALCRFYLRR